MNLKELRNKKVALLDAADQIIQKVKTEAREMTADETKAFDQHMKDSDGVDAEIKAAEKSIEERDARIAKLEAAKAENEKSEGRKIPAVPPANNAGQHVETRAEKVAKVALEARHTANLRGLKDTPENRFDAYSFGMWALKAMATRGLVKANEKAFKFCKENGLNHSADADERAISGSQNESTNFVGGYLVPEQFENMLIDLREQYGVFRKNAKVIPMKSDRFSRLRRSGGLTTYYPGELGAITKSNKTWDRVTLNAKKLAALSVYSNELNEDAMIDLGADLAAEIAYAFSLAEDTAGFTGTGTSATGGIIGLQQAFESLGTASNSAGIFVASTQTWASMVMADFTSVIALLPQYADGPGCAWYCHRTFFFQAMARLAAVAGGNRKDDISGEISQQKFLGYPVVFSQVLPKVSAASTIQCFFGRLDLAADFGSRRDTTIQFSEHATIGSDNMFEKEGIAIRGTERYDINCHDVGNNSATAGLRVPGPIIAQRSS